MNTSGRVRVAAVVAAAANGKSVSSVYDFSQGEHRLVSVKVVGGSVQGYDYATGSHFSGTGSGGALDFYDYETSSHVQLRLDGTKFSGYDYHASNHFTGTVSGSSISLYDFETSSFYNYSV